VQPGGGRDMGLSPIRLWWRLFSRASQSRWATTLALTVVACALPLLAGRAWLFLVVRGVETTGHVVRERDAVRYEVGGQSYRISLGSATEQHFFLWGDPVRVQYLRDAPDVARCPALEDRPLLALLFVFTLFIAAPLVLLWWETVVQPAWAALRQVRVARTRRRAATSAGPGCRAEPVAAVARPREHGTSSHDVKPA